MSIAPAPDANATADLRSDLVDAPPLGDDIHVWVLAEPESTVMQSAASTDGWWSLLAADEHERASRFHYARHASAFVANRARLRLLLAHYLDSDASSLSFTYSETGKPELSNLQQELYFNLSHTNGRALVAVSQRGRVGVDIEKMDSSTDALDLARSYFSEQEVCELSALDPSHQQAAFYRCWTRKEAFLKGLGDGLSRPLSEFTVSTAVGNALLLDCQWDPSAPATWQLFSLEFDPSYAAALAYEGNPFRLPPLPKLFCWSPTL